MDITKKKKLLKRLLEYGFILVLLATVGLIYFALAKDIAIIIADSKTGDYSAVKNHLQELGFEGAVSIAVLEMLQMIVIFIPAEFCQIAAGLAFPIYYAVPICVVGLTLGSIVIFAIVRLLHIRLEVMEKRMGKVQKFVKKINKSTSMTIIMYILFIMPVIPFGAVCYFASSSKISFRRYIAVCATGVFPEVLSSYVIGNVMYNNLGKGTTTFVVSLVVVLLLVMLLLVVLATIIKKVFFKPDHKEVVKPNFFFYNLVYFVINIIFAFKFKTKTKKCQKIKDKQFLLLSSHTNYVDFYFTAKSVYPNRINVVTNRYFADLKKCKLLLRWLNVIPKNLFAPDMSTIKNMLQARNNGCNIVICPEGRLSSDGRNFQVTRGTASLVKKLGLPVYYQTTIGGYFVKPKWRKGYKRITVDVRLEKIIDANDLRNMTENEVQTILDKYFTYDACYDYANNYEYKRSKVNVKGLDGVIHYCPNCNQEFSMTSTDKSLVCSKCGKEYLFDDKYMSEGMYISDFYQKQKEHLITQQPFYMKDECLVKVFNNKTGVLQDCGAGVCTINSDTLEFKGQIFGEEKTFSHTPTSLQALAYSANEQFEFYVDGVLYYFYPKNNQKVVKWSMIWDVLQERYIEYAKEKQGS